MFQPLTVSKKANTVWFGALFHNPTAPQYKTECVATFQHKVVLYIFNHTSQSGIENFKSPINNGLQPHFNLVVMVSIL